MFGTIPSMWQSGGGGFGEFQGLWDASVGTFPNAEVYREGDWFNVSVDGTVDGITFVKNDVLKVLVTAPSPTVYAGNWLKVDSPKTIFGANLGGWWTADAGVAFSGSPSRIDSWTSQAANARVGNPSATKPRYIATDVDGTPSIQQLKADNSTQYVRIGNAIPTLPVEANTTVWAFCKPSAAVPIDPKLILHTPFASHFMYAHAANGGDPNVQIPGQTPGPGGYWTPAQAVVTDWAVFRFNGNNGTSQIGLQVDDRAQFFTGQSWNESGVWQHLFGDSTQDNSFFGYYKEIVIVDGYFLSGSAEEIQMLAFFQTKYPSLVAY